MKKLLTTVTATVALLFATAVSARVGKAPAPTKIQHCEVTRVLDGDTVKCKILDQGDEFGEIKNVRLVKIDAPEKKQPFGIEAKAKLEELSLGKSVILNTQKTDIYGRTLGELYASSYTPSINYQMVKAGLAWAYLTSDMIFKEAEETAREMKIGLWNDENPVRPSDYRKMKKTKSALQSQ